MSDLNSLREWDDIADEFEDEFENDDDDFEHDDDDDDCDDIDYHDNLQDLFGQWMLNLPKIDLKLLGKITDWDLSPTGFSVTFGKGYSIAIEASGFEYKLGNGKIPQITDGTIDSFTFESPGMADFSISGLDMSAKLFFKALLRLDTDGMMKLILEGDETISGSGYSDMLFGGKGDDTLLGNDGNDRLLGGVGRDRIEGGDGCDTLLGGTNADTFVFAPGSGHDRIDDFRQDDIIDLSAYGFASFDEVAALIEIEGGHGKCASMEIELSETDSITMKNVHWWQITEDNFVL